MARTIRALLNVAAEHGVSRSVADTHKDNVALQRTHERAGSHQVGSTGDLDLYEVLHAYRYAATDSVSRGVLVSLVGSLTNLGRERTLRTGMPLSLCALPWRIGDLMRDDRGDVWLAPPPPIGVLRAMNVVARPLLRSPLAKRFDGVMLLEFRGRRTGRAMTVPVNFNLVDGVPMAFTTAVWRHNFTGGLPVTVIHRGQQYMTTGTLVPVSPAAMGEAVRKSLDTGGSAQRLGIRTTPDHDPTAEELAALGPDLGTSVIKFDFRPSSPRD